MGKLTLKASELGQAKIKQAREKKRWTVRYENITPLKEASKFLIRQHGRENNWNDNDLMWIKNWENLLRTEHDQDSNVVKREILQSKQGSIIKRIEKLINEGEIFAKDISYGSWSRFCSHNKKAIKARSFKAYCHILDLDWQEIVDDEENQIRQTITVSFASSQVEKTSPNNQLISSGSNDKTIKLWDANTGECLKTLTGHDSWILAVTFSPDGQTLITGSYDKITKFWNMKTGKCFQSFTGHEDDI